nr:TonB-dependent receptor [uncultured bacterium]
MCAAGKPTRGKRIADDQSLQPEQLTIRERKMNLQSIFPKKILTTAVTGTLLLTGIPGIAEMNTLEEVVVTARKRQETLQDVPFSVQAVTEKQMRNRGAIDLETLSNNVAGFTVQNLGPGQSQVAIRGISAGQIVRDQPGIKEQVGVYLDESVISLSLFTPDLDFYDLNRVEVLRGPQGTLFGSGSLSGTVRYITNQPTTDAMEGSIEAGLNSVTDGGIGGEMKGMINIPLSDKAAFRLVSYYTQYGGFIDAIQPGGNTKDDVNDGERKGFRASIKYQPNDSLTITPRVIYQDTDINGFNRQDEFNVLANKYTTTRPAVNIGSREQFTQLEEKFEDEFTLVDLTLQYETDNLVFTSISSYTDREILVLRDATQLSGSVTAQLIDPREVAFTIDSPLYDTTDVEVLTQEFRVASAGESAFQWVVGVFYSDIEREYAQSLPTTGYTAITGVPTAGIIAPEDNLFFSDIPYDFEQLAVFGEVSVDITDRFNLSAGLRWYDFEESRELNFDGIFADQTIGLKGNTESDGFSPRLLASYDLTDETQLNAQVSKGFRLGGINDPLNVPLCTPQDLVTFGGNDSFDDEEVLNYEIGVKNTFAEGRGRFNAAIFYADIEDLQATLTAGSCSSRIVYNIPDAHAMGVEFELFTMLGDNLEIGLTGSYVESELDSTITTTDSLGNVSVLAGLEDGNRLPTVPELQLAASATYYFNFNEAWEGYVTATAQHVGSRYTQIADQESGSATFSLSNPISHSIGLRRRTTNTVGADPNTR